MKIKEVRFRAFTVANLSGESLASRSGSTNSPAKATPTVSIKSKLLDQLRRMAVLMELDGANSFRVNAYTKAIRALGDETIDLEKAAADGNLTKIDGVGKGIAEKIEEYIKHGSIEEVSKLASKYPPGLVEMTEIPGFGAKKARLVFEELGMTTIEELERGCEDGRVAELKGFGRKSAEKIVQGIAQMRKHSGRFRIDVAWESAQPILKALRDHKSVQCVEVAGSLRRWRETAKDLDFVCATANPDDVMEFFTTLASVDTVTGKGSTKSSVVLDSGIGADLRCVDPAHYPFTLQHFSGSKEHNTRLRGLAKDKGMKSSEYGLFPDGQETSLPAETEEDIYKHLGLAYIEPEMREDTGEIEAAQKDQLPLLVTSEDLVGLPHMHTEYSDGQPTLEDYAKWAAENGYEWMGISDHSKTAAYAGGLQPDRVRRQWAEIARVNKEWKHRGVVLLKGIESDILTDGALDYDEDLLKEFDFIVASIHSQFNFSEEQQTARMLAAIENPYTSILGHMTGRLLLKRDGYQVNQKEIIRRCAKESVIIEINSNPARLDLDWRLLHFALEEGCYLCLSPDAHTLGMLEHIRYGVGIARKGWVTKDRLANCWNAAGFLKFVRKRRS